MASRRPASSRSVRSSSPKPRLAAGAADATPSAQPAAGEPFEPRLADRLRQLRAERNWSLETLAGASGVSRSMLSQIERDQANPTLAVTLRIAAAFQLSLSDLLQMPAASRSMMVIRAADQTYHFRSDQHCRIRTLSPLNLEKDVEFYEVRLEPQGELRSTAHYRGTREFLTVQKGQVRIESAGENEVLAAGDSASYRADVPHALINAGRAPALLLLVVIYT
jgi:transcriptional regulator with XRE-family HTH domain